MPMRGFHDWQAGAKAPLARSLAPLSRTGAESDASDAKRNFVARTAQGLENAAFRLSLTP